MRGVWCQQRKKKKESSYICLFLFSANLSMWRLDCLAHAHTDTHTGWWWRDAGSFQKIEKENITWLTQPPRGPGSFTCVSVRLILRFLFILKFWMCLLSPRPVTFSSLRCVWLLLLPDVLQLCPIVSPLPTPCVLKPCVPVLLYQVIPCEFHALVCQLVSEFCLFFDLYLCLVVWSPFLIKRLWLRASHCVSALWNLQSLHMINRIDSWYKE